MRVFIYSESPRIATLLSKRYRTVSKEDVIMQKNTHGKMLSIRAIPEDVFVIDTHGGGAMVDSKGIELAYRLITQNKNTPKVIAYSWFPEEYLLKTNALFRNLVQNDNFQFIQLPNL